MPGETGPTGGPAMTDVLGICEAWGDGRALVRRADGTLVEIATADVVSGKPVPPRPSVRQRVSARAAESHAGSHWPEVERQPLGEWELRTDPRPVDRLRKRANSCLAMGDPGMPLVEAAAAVAAYYRARRRQPLVQVEVGSTVDAWFESAGWGSVPGGDALFLLGSLARAQRSLPRTDHEPVLHVDGPRAEARLDDLAIGRASVDGDWLGLHDLTVDPEHRRHGRGRAVVDALLEWGAEQGATTVWLHVETDNEPARTFYDRLGLAEHHACRYLLAPDVH